MKQSKQSMTGFGKGEAQDNAHRISVEIKSVNNRFKDFKFRSPHSLNFMELEIRRILSAQFKRGSFEISLNLRKESEQATNIKLDYKKISSFLEQLDKGLKGHAKSLAINPTDFIRSDFLAEEELDEEVLRTLVCKACDIAVEQLKVSREEEGGELINKLLAHYKAFVDSFNQIAPHKNTYQEKVRDKLKARLESENLGIDQPRLLQEIIFYLEKLDIDEEINRTSIHLEKLMQILKGDGEVGRQIDFLVQELNRETNTMGSKSNSVEVSQLVVEMKTQLEKIREQALNLE